MEDHAHLLEQLIQLVKAIQDPRITQGTGPQLRAKIDGRCTACSLFGHP